MNTAIQHFLMHLAVIFVALVLCCLPCSAFQITEFCPDPYLSDDTDEYLVLSGFGILDGISISDGEGGFRFPPGTVLNGSVTVARYAVAFNTTHGFLPDYEWYDSTPLVPDVISGDKLRLANVRDELVMYNGMAIIQKITWPGDVKSREGQVHFLKDGIWDRRPYFIGQTDLDPASFSDVTVTAFVSPDNAGDVFGRVLDSAQKSIHVNVYEFTSPLLAKNLIDAKNRGTDVVVLVEGGPVGGISPEEKTILWTLNQSGIPVHQMAAVPLIKPPYRFNHAKYAVIDGQSVILTSENFKGSGIPTTGYRGNRGWGVYLENPDLAEYFERLFLSDISIKNSIPAYGVYGPNEVSSTVTYKPEFLARQYHNATVIPVISPDTSYLITDLLNSARESIEIEQAYITNESTDSLNPYLSAAIDASRRGVHVKILLDSYWYNVEEEADNDEMVALINQIATAEHLPLEAKCANLDLNNLDKIHNKGVIVDNRSVLVSSINWNSNSPNFNRETGVIVLHSGVAEYFREVFEDDWQPRMPTREPVLTDNLKYACVVLVILLLLILYGWRKRDQ